MSVCVDTNSNQSDVKSNNNNQKQSSIEHKPRTSSHRRSATAAPLYLDRARHCVVLARHNHPSLSPSLPARQCTPAASRPTLHWSLQCYMVRLLAGAQRSSIPDTNNMSQPLHNHHTNNNNHHSTNPKQQQQQQEQQQQQHTLVLIQPTPNSTTKTYSDHPSLDTALDHIVNSFEQQLTGRSPQHLQYDITQLFAYVDRLSDLAVLVFEPELRAYQPHDKQWTKSALYEHLKRQAAGGQ